MTYQPALFFPHRRNKDGSLDSICLKCFATIGSQRTEPAYNLPNPSNSEFIKLGIGA